MFSLNEEAIAGLEEMGRRFLALSYPSLSLFKEAKYFFFVFSHKHVVAFTGSPNILEAQGTRECFCVGWQVAG